MVGSTAAIVAFHDMDQLLDVQIRVKGGEDEKSGVGRLVSVIGVTSYLVISQLRPHPSPC